MTVGNDCYDASDRHGPIAVVANGTAGWVPPRSLAPWLDDPTDVARIRWMSDVTGVDLIHLGTVAGQRDLSDPASNQPLATALQILVGEQLLRTADPAEIILAGHGTGEIAVAVLAGALAPEAGLQLAVRVGQAQSAAASRRPGGQVALLGGDPDDITERAHELGLSVAAYNGGGAIVVSGPSDALDELLTAPPLHARAERLPASGAYTSELMTDVTSQVHRALSDLRIGALRHPAVSGFDGLLAESADSYINGIVAQLTGPVHWDLIMDSLAKADSVAILELPPAGALSALVVRGMPGVQVTPIRTPLDLVEATARTMPLGGRHLAQKLSQEEFPGSATVPDRPL
ncbi:ACP S-malonyltransferase [Microlunatus soli]|uniref:[acyl-carrier-protein] S-malonyltransferase n=1 Tax=Microlunatus soli TaxID=630515 RepID=A0A1H1SP81_9ACTN|nr:acyltransferase domain-containing protein [Microlunatus soli]SDS49817.1 [acyl-carrier-protein] S-malonyltransferase [Microlunatus soli]